MKCIFYLFENQLPWLFKDRIVSDLTSDAVVFINLANNIFQVEGIECVKFLVSFLHKIRNFGKR